ncbi:MULTISPECIES: PadR family transcriptional regulator [Micromonospora]|uniref:PadR family transcriptional regulator n=1 Tax=Micromonospora TaxID=1873 RepID=UPI00098D3143|nr:MULTISPECIES: PadR family transcriptional regulator [unclassified Micromonospora]MDI5938726.1 PadR family transcriptional regulator [Micromonospora sp. DH15]OON31889.1 PadR family transcriptional regulator [Micromonospora sp. Rc5]
MPLNATQNSLVLPMLGLLVEQPAHGYDITTRLRERYGHLSVTRSTVTSLLKALEKAGLITSRLPERVGNRPPRRAYELTAAGLADFRHKVEAGVRDTVAASLDFVMAVAYVGVLPIDQAASILDGRADRLDRELAALSGLSDGDVPEVHMLEVAYWRTIVAAEAAWIRNLVGRIRSNEISWPAQPTDEHRSAEA